MLALAVLLIVVMTRGALGRPDQAGNPEPKWLIPGQGLLEIFGYFLLVLIGMELLETLKAYLKKDCHSRPCGAGGSAHYHGAQGDY